MSKARVMSLLFDRFANIAAQYGRKTALIFNDERISYAALLERVNTRANALQATWGLASGARIPYVGLNDPEQIVTLLACAKVGAIFLPINYRLVEAEIMRIKEDAVVLAVETIDPPALRVDPPTSQGGSRGCLLVYTSGTTGEPKGALHSQEALLANARASWAAHEMTVDDLVLSTLPLFHVGGLCIQTLPALLIGATVLLHDRFDANAWLGAVQTHKPTLSLVVPATMKAIQAAPAWATTDLTSLRGVMAGSSTIPRHFIDAFHARSIPVGQITAQQKRALSRPCCPFPKPYPMQA
jgi:fatty-acyl-CoA synthase